MSVLAIGFPGTSKPKQLDKSLSNRFVPGCMPTKIMADIGEKELRARETWKI
jgi:hypothetical protein